VRPFTDPRAGDGRRSPNWSPVPAILFPVRRCPSMVACVRHRVVRQALAWGAVPDDETREGLELVVSELVTNSVRYGEGDVISVGLSLDLKARLLTVEAHDASTTEPSGRSADVEDEGGRGLLLVDVITERHGWEPAGRANGSGPSCGSRRYPVGRPAPSYFSDPARGTASPLRPRPS
jgi:anti-sigma regulatory factor (Ser/Thr protein kinase)